MNKCTSSNQVFGTNQSINSKILKQYSCKRRGNINSPWVASQETGKRKRKKEEEEREYPYDIVRVQVKSMMTDCFGI